MALIRWLSGTEQGSRTFYALSLGELHIKVARKETAEGDPPVWEAFVHCKEGGTGLLCAVLHLVEESRDDLVRQLEMTLPALSEAE